MARVAALESFAISKGEKLPVSTVNLGLLYADSEARERQWGTIGQSEVEAREASVMVEKIRKEDDTSVQFLKLASTTDNVLSDPTEQGF